MNQFILWIIGLVFLFLVIKWAIDSSETADNIREIRKILSRQYSDGRIEDETGIKPEVVPDENLYASNVPVDECPACHSKILETDRECPSCGLTLRNNE